MSVFYINIDLDFCSVDTFKILSGLFFEKRASFSACNIFIVKNLKTDY